MPRRRSRARLIAAALCGAGLAGCAFAPPLGARLPRRFDEASRVFDERVQARFPAGSRETDLTAELRRERFKLAPVALPSAANPEGYTGFADHGGNMGPTCELHWQVFWRAQAGRITVIHGRYEPTCL